MAKLSLWRLCGMKKSGSLSVESCLNIYFYPQIISLIISDVQDFWEFTRARKEKSESWIILLRGCWKLKLKVHVNSAWLWRWRFWLFFLTSTCRFVFNWLKSYSSWILTNVGSTYGVWEQGSREGVWQGKLNIEKVNGRRANKIYASAAWQSPAA